MVNTDVSEELGAYVFRVETTRFEVLTAVSILLQVFQDGRRCQLVNTDVSGELCALHFLELKLRDLRFRRECRYDTDLVFQVSRRCQLVST